MTILSSVLSHVLETEISYRRPGMEFCKFYTVYDGNDFNFQCQMSYHVMNLNDFFPNGKTNGKKKKSDIFLGNIWQLDFNHDISILETWLLETRIFPYNDKTVLMYMYCVVLAITWSPISLRCFLWYQIVSNWIVWIILQFI